MICSALSSPSAALGVGGKISSFFCRVLDFSPQFPPAPPQTAAPVLLAGFLIPDRSVSLALRSSLRFYASE
ncbi:hypothetical protein SLE2022_052060 [Rubroshorea leprosula]